MIRNIGCFAGGRKACSGKTLGLGKLLKRKYRKKYEAPEQV